MAQGISRPPVGPAALASGRERVSPSLIVHHHDGNNETGLVVRPRPGAPDVASSTVPGDGSTLTRRRISISIIIHITPPPQRDPRSH